MMYGFLVAVQEALQAEAGGLLECLTAARIYLYRPAKETALPCVVIWSGPEKTILANDDYDYSEFTAIVNGYMVLGIEDDIEVQAYKTASLGRAIKKVLLNNSTLKGAKNPSGFLKDDDDARIKIPELHYFEESILPPPEGQSVSQVQLIVTGRVHGQGLWGDDSSLF